MNESQFGNRIRHLLNLGARQVPSPIAARLAQARERALARLRPASAPALAWADNVTGQVGWGGLALRVLLPLIVLAIGGSAMYTWQQAQRAAEVEEIDAQLLTDDLPIDAYLDRGFQNWLKTRAGGE